MAKKQIFTIFMIFNVIFGIFSIVIIGVSGYSMYKIKFNVFLLIILIVGIIMFSVFILGFSTRKNKNRLFLYIILVIIILFAQIAFALLFWFYGDLNDFVRNNITKVVEIDEKEKDKIIKMLLITICISAFFCLLDLIFALLYFNKIKNKIKEEVDNVEKVMNRLDYTCLTPDMSSMK